MGGKGRGAGNGTSSICEEIQVKEGVCMSTRTDVCEHAKWQPKWVVEKYDENGELYDVVELDGNCLLNEGINEMWKLITGKGGTPFNNTNSYIGVGDGTATAYPTQTGLLGTNKTYMKLDSSYPIVEGQTIKLQATYGPDDANHEWQEITLASGSSDVAVNLNRAVGDLGRKAQGTTWLAHLEIILS